jgi:hypothetical protein
MCRAELDKAKSRTIDRGENDGKYSNIQIKITNKYDL